MRDCGLIRERVFVTILYQAGTVLGAGDVTWLVTQGVEQAGCNFKVWPRKAL